MTLKRALLAIAVWATPVAIVVALSYHFGPHPLIALVSGVLAGIAGVYLAEAAVEP